MNTVGLSDPYIIICAFQTKTGKEASIQTTELNILGEAVDLVFRATDKLPDYLEQDKKKRFKINGSAPLVEVELFETVCGPLEKWKSIKRVFVNFHVPLSSYIPTNGGAIKDPYKIWASLILKIGLVCQDLFPNMRPEESNFNVHFGFNHFRSDQHLLPNTPLSALYLNPK